MLRFVRAYVTKTIKTPAMGESIQEGTLTQWIKKQGDYVQRDEHIATVETDKIDVQINSPEAGTLVHLFANEGDTVLVGGELFKIDTDGAPTQTQVEPTPVPAPKVEPPKVQPQTVQPPKQKVEKSSLHARVPLIKFLGKNRWTEAKPLTQVVQEHALEQYELPKRFGPLPISDLEMQMIELGGAMPDPPKPPKTKK